MELYCSKCRMSYTALEEQGEYRQLPECRAGGAHTFTDEVPVEDKLATHMSPYLVQ